MRQFFKNSVVFGGILAVCIIVFTILWGEFSPDFFKDNLHYKKGSNSFFYHRMRQADTVQNIDVLVLGASQTYRGFDPRIFKQYNKKLFNLGSSNQTPLQTEMLVNKYLEKLHPNLIIYEVNPEGLSMDGVESSLDFMCNGIIDKYVFQLALRVNAIKSWFTFIYASYRSVFCLDKDFIHPKKMDYDTYVEGGFVEKEYHPFWGKNLPDSLIWNVHGYQERALIRIVNKLKKSGAQVVIVQAPLEQSFYKKVQNKELFNQLYNSFNLPMYDYNKLMPLSREYFYDNNHLNQKGVELFNRDLIMRLQLDDK